MLPLEEAQCILTSLIHRSAWKCEILGSLPKVGKGDPSLSLWLLADAPDAGAQWSDNGLVFASGKGTPLDAQNIVNRNFKPRLRRAGLPDIRWHDLRHTCLTILLARGTHPKYVQHLAGHASIQLTFDRYSHWMPSMSRNTADGMDEALG
jgi:integrase